MEVVQQPCEILLEETHIVQQCEKSPTTACTGRKRTTTSDQKKFSVVNLLKVNKPMVPLKICLCLFYGGAVLQNVFLGPFLKRQGLSLAHISYINILQPVAQLSWSMLCGIIADKIGKSKPVFLVNLFLLLFFVNGLLLVPNLEVNEEKHAQVEGKCQIKDPATSLSGTKNAHEIHFGNCTFECIRNGTLSSEVSSCFAHNVTLCENATYLCQCFKSLFLTRTEGSICLLYEVDSVFNSSSLLNSCSLQPFNCSFLNRFGGEIGTNKSNSSFLFAVFLLLVLGYSMCLGACFRFVDIVAMSMVKRYNSDLGRERIWTITGILITSSLAALVLNIGNLQNGKIEFIIVFGLFDILIILNMVAVWNLGIEIKPRGKNMLKKSYFLLKSPENVAFLLVVLILGTDWGFSRLYSGIYLYELGAPSKIFPLLLAVQSVVGFPALFTSDSWFQHFGINSLMILALVAYTCSNLWYSYFINPWWSLLCETSTIFTYHILWVAVVRYSHDVAPEDLTSTVLSTIGSIHFWIGRGTGSLIGGLIMSEYGGRWAYRIMAAMCTTSAILYSSFLFFRRRHLKKRQCESTVHKN